MLFVWEYYYHTNSHPVDGGDSILLDLMILKTTINKSIQTTDINVSINLP